MATQIPENINAKRTTISMHHVTSRYLKPSTGSCHDRCKNGTKDESELKKPTRRLGVRKILVKKNKVKRSVEPIERKLTKTKPKPKPKSSPTPKIKQENSLPSKRIGVSVYGLLTNRKLTQNELKLAKKNVKVKPVSSPTIISQKSKKEAKNVRNTRIVSRSNSRSLPRSHKPVSPLNDEQSMTKTELKQLIAEKITEMTEMTLHEAENAELELVPLTVEIESPIKDERGITDTALKELIAEKIGKLTLLEAENEDLEFVPLTVEIESTPTVITESTDVPNIESSQSSSDKQVLIDEHENADIVSEDEGPRRLKFRRGKILGDEDDGPIRLKFRRGKILEDNENDGPTRLKFRRGKILEDDEDDGPTRLKFRRGKILEDDEDDGPTRLKFTRGKILEDEDEQSISKINYKEKLVEEATDNCETESEKVNLKHQEMQEKKEAQELLNRLIEETASKLEVDRKTKVEALVGAFESVISLKDDTPSSP